MSLLEWLKFWSKFYRIPLFWNTVSEYPPPPKWKLSEILALWLFSFRIPTPKWKLSEIVALWLFSFRIPPPPWKWKLSEILALWLFSFRIPPPRKWKLLEILALWLFSFRIPPRKWKLSEILALWLFSFRIPPPPKMKIVRDLGTLTFQFQNTPLPPKMKIVRDLGTLTFQFQNTPPENENCQRSWHFDFSVSEYPPPKWKLSEILALWLFSFRISPFPPKMKIVPENWNLGRSWHFKTFQFQNYVCGKLPHVETLSSPDNYSFRIYCRAAWIVAGRFVLVTPMGRNFQNCCMNSFADF